MSDDTLDHIIAALELPPKETFAGSTGLPITRFEDLEDWQKKQATRFQAFILSKLEALSLTLKDQALCLRKEDEDPALVGTLPAGILIQV